MTKEQRHQIIMNALLKKGAAQVTELADILQVSSVTIRKDLTELDHCGADEPCCHHGAVPANLPSKDPSSAAGGKIIRKAVPGGTAFAYRL